ncbi:indoleacetaldoxime dehydratase-like [Phalaenopsis equestris]|uniref:indoleacetaldoxime dehydratase-like n=1 Tax=Phalaenopsis equestris TaxID=78828 RepID=UPI0009E5D069|nr:indoleacetaldoxime dehydratase-like [Phalaenopsis equestris]
MPCSLSSPIISLLLHPPTMLLLLILPLIILLILFTFFPLSNKITIGAPPLPPSPPKLPIIGNLHQLSPLPHRSLRALSDLHGPLILLRLGRHPTLVVSSPSAVQEITQTQDHLFLNRPLFKATHELFYHGRDIAFAPYGEYWREMKKTAILHLLSSKKVESYKKVRKEEVGFMMEEIGRTMTTATNMTEVFNSLSRDVVSRVVIGRAARRTWWEHGLRSLIDESSELTGEFYVGDYIPLLGSIFGVVGGFERRLRNVFQRSDELLEQIMRERRKEEDDGSYVANHSFLDCLLTLQGKMKCEGVAFDDASIKAIVKDMFGAGTEATSIPMEWAMAELLRHPASMKKLKQEIINTVGPNETIIKEKHLSKMSYLKAVIKEVLRLHPPGSIIVRRHLTEETTINGYRIPKGTMVLIGAI